MNKKMEAVTKSDLGGTLILVGFMHTPFTRLFDSLMLLHGEMPRPILVQAGPLKNHQFFNIADNVFDYLASDTIEMLIQNARLVISHAGVGSIRSANRYGKVPLIFARYFRLGEHIDNHQLEFAQLMSNNDLAMNVEPSDNLEQIRQKIAEIFDLQNTTVPQINFRPIQLNNLGRILGVSSVGGHRAELSEHLCSIDPDKVIRVTDEECAEVKSKKFILFSSCNKKYMAPFRLVEAIFFLIVNKKKIDVIVSTGAGVGAIFIIAGKLLGIQGFIIESMTRIESPGLWFKLAYPFSKAAYAYSTSKWINKYPRINKIIIDLNKNNTQQSVRANG